MKVMKFDLLTFSEYRSNREVTGVKICFLLNNNGRSYQYTYIARFFCFKLIQVLNLRDSVVEVFKGFKNLLTKLNFPGPTIDFKVMSFGPGSDLLRRRSVLQFRY